MCGRHRHPVKTDGAAAPASLGNVRGQFLGLEVVIKNL